MIVSTHGSYFGIPERLRQHSESRVHDLRTHQTTTLTAFILSGKKTGGSFIHSSFIIAGTVHPIEGDTNAVEHPAPGATSM